jgi:hypothetical protein
VPTCFNLIDRQFFGPSADCCSSELDKKQPNDIKRNVPLAFEPSRCNCSSEDFTSPMDPERTETIERRTHSCGGEISLRPEQFWEQ